MFNVGDKVAYPMHGAGIVEKIEEKQILGEQRSYYIIHVLHGNLQIMVPVNGSEQVGLRPIVSEEVIGSVFEVLAADSTPMDDNWNRRNRDNMEKMKTGDLALVAGVIRNLLRVDRVKKLSTGEKKLLSNAMQILASEIVCVRNITEEDALKLIEETV